MLKNTKSDTMMAYTNVGGVGPSSPGVHTETSTASHGTIPANEPNPNDSQLGLPGLSYFSMSSPKKIIDALTPNTARMAAMSLMPQIIAMSTIMMEELIEYSITFRSYGPSAGCPYTTGRRREKR